MGIIKRPGCTNSLLVSLSRNPTLMLGFTHNTRLDL